MDVWFAWSFDTIWISSRQLLPHCCYFLGLGSHSRTFLSRASWHILLSLRFLRNVRRFRSSWCMGCLHTTTSFVEGSARFSMCADTFPGMFWRDSNRCSASQCHLHAGPEFMWHAGGCVQCHTYEEHPQSKLSPSLGIFPRKLQRLVCCCVG